MRTLLVIASVLVGAADGRAQFVDHQAGANFPTAATAFGTGRSENVDAGDIELDGDLDVLVVNGGDGAAQLNELYLNQGGLQGGTPGTFGNVTATRLAGIPADTSRDGEFADFDGDGDLDIYVANRGTTVNGGEVSRAHVNLGGFQLGTIGFFAEDTDGFWGTLVSVPPTDEEGVQDGFGPFRDFTCDCDFGDLDDDGDLDLFHSSYGPNLAGNRDSRIFLNDGDGRFDELWPWADAGADTQGHTLDIDLADLDGDLDLDVFSSSRESQARVFRNNLAGGAWSGDPFTDVTQTALLDTGAVLTGASNYEGEIGDLDGDGDFDVWMVNYFSVFEVILRNEGGLTFTKVPWVKGDGLHDDNEVDYLDFDADGDLDAFLANFSGENWLFQNGIAEGVTEAEGYFHKTGTTLFGSVVSWPELPASNNGGTTLDADCVDIDGDGDLDVLVANDANQQNRLLINALGVPDTHAPTFLQRTVQGDTSGGDPVVLHVQVRDNAAYYVVDGYDVRIVYTRDGGPETCVPMARQGGQQFRGVIPALAGEIAYRFEVTDGAGNTSVSPTTVYQHTAVPAPPAWQGLGCGTEGLYGEPRLWLDGPQTGGSTLTLTLSDARPTSLFLLWLAAPVSMPLAALGGVVYALPTSEQFLLATDTGGTFTAFATWPPGFPGGIPHIWQCIVADPASPFGLVLSNAVLGTTP